MQNAESFTVPGLTVAMLIVQLVFCFILPIGLMLFFRRRYKVQYTPFLAGLFSFIIFALILESFAHSFFLGQNQIGNFISGNTAVFVLYTGFAAGIFEETGRLVFLFFLRKKYKKPETALIYGVGHGGIECWLVAGFGALPNLIAALAVNNNGLESVVASDTTGTMINSILALASTDPIVFVYASVERLFAMVVHVCLSYWVWRALEYKKIKSYFYAIILHAVLNFGAAVFQKGMLDMLYTEVYIAVIAISIAFLTYKQFQQDRAKEIEKIQTEQQTFVTEINSADIIANDEIIINQVDINKVNKDNE